MPFELTGTDILSAGGGLEVTVREAGPGRWSWAVANTGDADVAVTAVRLVLRLGGLGGFGGAGPVRVFQNGYQSWSPTGAVTLGEHVDPSRTQTGDPLMDDVVDFARRVHHADPAVAPAGEVRSEQVTAFRAVGGDDPAHLVGFVGGATHEGTLRVRFAPGGGDAIEVIAEAFLGGARLPGGASRDLHDVVVAEGSDVLELLEVWAAEAGRAEGARVDAPFQVGWCSWYHYFHSLTEEHVRSNLALAGDWPFTVFQVDDGYQAAIGDWLVTNDKFSSGVDHLAADIAGAGYTPGIWMAPFLAHPRSAVLQAHPHWAARDATLAGTDEDLLMGWWNPDWDGFQGTLDTTHPEVQQHLADTAAALVDMGYRYLKLDFTCAPALDRGRWHDPTATPAERVRRGYEAIRRGAGDDTFILACGCPVGSVVGVVDAMRIGPDVSPSWERIDEFAMPGYEEVSPATKGAWRSTLARSFLHRRLWLNDPDCIMLRTSETQLSAEGARAWALAVGVSGGMAIVSDDLALLGPAERALLDEALALGRASDAAAAEGVAARCGALLAGAGDHPVPTRLTDGVGTSLPLLPPAS